MELKIQKATTLKEKPQDESKLGFGEIFTDHMFLMNYTEGQGWHDARIIPYADFSLNPAAMVLHYGQAIFEGMKAYRNPEGKVQLFRPMDNLQRFNRSAERLCIPAIDCDFVLDALRQLISLEQDWVPHLQGTSLYIRPFAIATDPQLGVHVAKQYIFAIILSPVGAYYAEGLKPVRIFVENEYVRSVRGGMGFAKAAGNYACSLIADHEAQKKGCAQVLWLDGVERKYIEEVGSMNIMFKIAGKIVTPPLRGSILAGITRDSVLKLAKQLGIEAEERLISIDEVFAAYENGTLEEVFGTGTAAVISPVGGLVWGDREIVINNNEIGPTAQLLYNTLTGIQYGTVEDKQNWVVAL
jgi:branched-chain amino acid aminotransferase